MSAEDYPVSQQEEDDEGSFQNGLVLVFVLVLVLVVVVELKSSCFFYVDGCR